MFSNQFKINKFKLNHRVITIHWENRHGIIIFLMTTVKNNCSKHLKDLLIINKNMLIQFSDNFLPNKYFFTACNHMLHFCIMHYELLFLQIFEYFDSLSIMFCSQQLLHLNTIMTFWLNCISNFRCLFSVIP